MREISTAFGVLYIETSSEREEANRIKLYDSQKHYLDYFSVEGYSEKEVDDFVEEKVSEILKLKRVDSLMEYLGIDSYTIGKNWIDLLEDIYADGYDYDFDADKYLTVPDGEEITESDVLQNEYVCSIGDELVLICE